MNWAHVHLVVNNVPVFGSLLGAAFLVLALVARDRAGWARAALVTLAIAFVATAAAFLSGSPALDVVTGMPRTSAKALEDHHVNAVVATSVMGTVLIATIVAMVMHKRRGLHPRWSLAMLLATTLVASGTFAWTGLAGGRINHPELQKPGDLDEGPAGPHH